MTKGKHGTGGWGCDGCHQPPWDHTLPGPLDNETLHEWQAYCCGCIPNCVNVVVRCGGEVSTKVFCSSCEFVASNPYLWGGDIPIANVTVDFAFSFVVENGRCYICLHSNYFGIYGTVPGDCYEITAYQRDDPIRFCERLWLDLGAGPLPVKWTIQTALCGEMEIEISPEEASAIHPRFSPCRDANGDLIEDTDPIRDLCGGCSCICDCACIITTDGTGFANMEIVCRDGVGWTTYNGVRIEIQEDYTTGCCKLVITDYGNVPPPEFEGEQSVIIGDGNVDNLCPHPKANFTWANSDAVPQAVLWHCANDFNCDVQLRGGCCESMVPRVLSIDFDGGYDCGCGSIGLSLIYDDLDGVWKAYHPTAFCDGPIRIALSCGANGSWSLSVTDNVCSFPIPMIAYGECEPLSLLFSGEVSGVDCCNDISGTPKTITITITE